MNTTICHRLWRGLCVCLLMSIGWLTTAATAATRYMTRQEIRTMLDRGEAALQDGDNIQAASLLLQSKLQAEQSGHPDLVYIADIDLGSVYFNLDEVGESMYYFQEALALVEQEGMDWEHRFSAMNGVAGSYFRLKDYKRAKEMLDQCLEAALTEQDSVAIVDFAMNLVRITTRQNNQQQALYYDSTMHAYLTPAYANAVREYLSDVEMEMYYNQNRYDKARSLANYLLDSADFASGRSAALYTLCCMAQHDGNYAEALRLAREALRNSSFSRRRTLYDLMGNIYQQMGQQQRALACKDSALLWSDSAQQRSDMQLLQQSQVQSEATRIRREFQQQQEQLATTQKMIVLGVLAFAAIIASVVWYYHRQRCKARAEQKRIEQAQKEQEITLKQKNQELLSATQITSARNEVVGELVSSLQGIKDISQNAEVKSLISNLKQQLGDSTRQDDFLIQFRQSNPHFVENILARHPDLLDSDLRFLSYVLQRLPQADIASLLNITPDSCKRRKIRLSKKLGLESSTALYEYLCSFK